VVLSIILVVLFTMTMFLWGFTAFGHSEAPVKNGALLAWFACLILGLVVFLSGFGVIVWRPGP
jgi:uncharacterized membrane protein